LRDKVLKELWPFTDCRATCISAVAENWKFEIWHRILNAGGSKMIFIDAVLIAAAIVVLSALVNM